MRAPLLRRCSFLSDVCFFCFDNSFQMSAYFASYDWKALHFLGGKSSLSKSSLGVESFLFFKNLIALRRLGSEFRDFGMLCHSGIYGLLSNFAPKCKAFWLDPVLLACLTPLPDGKGSGLQGYKKEGT